MALTVSSKPPRSYAGLITSLINLSRSKILSLFISISLTSVWFSSLLVVFISLSGSSTGVKPNISLNKLLSL